MKKNINIVTIIITCIVLFFSLPFVILFVSSINSCYRYTRTHDQFVEVEAVVTDHKVYHDSEDGDEYTSYYEFTYNGEKYRNEYETRSSESNLSPVGTVVHVKINPDDPEETLDSLISFSKASAFFGTPLIVFSILFLKYRYRKYLIKKHPIEIIDNDTIEYFLKASLKCRKIRPCLLALSIFYMVLKLSFPLVFGTYPVMFSAIFGAAFLGLSVFDIYKWLCIRNNSYTVYHGKFNGFSIARDAEDNSPMYRAVYQFEEDFPLFYESISEYLYRNFPEKARVYPVLYNYQIKRKKHSLRFFKKNSNISVEWDWYF